MSLPGGAGPPGAGIKFQDFDLTLTDRELDDFLSFMEHQSTGGGVYTTPDTLPQLPDVAMDFPGLQLQPHGSSPSRSEEGSAGVGGPGRSGSGVGATAGGGTSRSTGGGPGRSGGGPPASDGSLTSAAMSSPAHDTNTTNANNTNGATQQQMQQQLMQQQAAAAGGSSASPPMDISSQQQQQFYQQQQQQQLQGIKAEQIAVFQQQQPQLVQFTACNSLPAVLAASAGSAAVGGASTLAGTLLPIPAAAGGAAAAVAVADPSMLIASCPTTLGDFGQQQQQQQQPGYCLQPMQWHSSTAVTSLAAAGGAVGAVGGAVGGQQQQAGPSDSQSQPLPQLVFMQPVQPQQQQQQPQQQQQMAPLNMMTQQMAAFAGLASPTGSIKMERQASGGGSGGGGRASRQLQQLQAQQQQQQLQRSSYDGGAGSSSGGKPQVSHSTVEKQRRDRLNSLIDELSDMVPPADPKYGTDNNTASVRRPKHVVLTDTINLLRAMQTKLQIEEAEICTLKQQAAAVGAIAAQHHTGHTSVPEAADAMMQAAAAAAAAGGGSGASGGGAFSPVHSPPLQQDGAAGAACAPFDLPTAPEGGVTATGVMVEQGIGCLYVKVNCKDRKGLLSDVVSALRAFPIVISTAAITTTKDGSVHDVFEVRMEDPSVTAEDIQFAVQQALYASAQRAAHTKRLRRETSGLMMQQDG